MVVRIRDKICEYCEKPFYDNSSWAYRKSCSIVCRNALRVKKIKISNGYNRTKSKVKLCNTVEKFIAKSRELHGDIFDYSRVVYINRYTNVIIGCKICYEWFEQTPKVHYRHHGIKCTKCRYKRIGDLTRLNNVQFVEKAKIVHGNRYDYDMVEYINSHSKVKLKCNDCDLLFMSKPNNILNGHGCPNCANIKRANNWSSLSENIWLNNLGIPQENRQKWIFVDNRNICVDALYEGKVYEFYGSYWHGDPRVFSKNDRNKTNGILYEELFQETLKRESMLNKAGYEVIFLWEFDFKLGMLHSIEHPQLKESFI